MKAAVSITVVIALLVATTPGHTLSIKNGMTRAAQFGGKVKKNVASVRQKVAGRVQRLGSDIKSNLPSSADVRAFAQQYLGREEFSGLGPEQKKAIVKTVASLIALGVVPAAVGMANAEAAASAANHPSMAWAWNSLGVAVVGFIVMFIGACAKSVTMGAIGGVTMLGGIAGITVASMIGALSTLGH